MALSIETSPGQHLERNFKSWHCLFETFYGQQLEKELIESWHCLFEKPCGQHLEEL
jgi:hypothetical protein